MPSVEGPGVKQVAWRGLQQQFFFGGTARVLLVQATATPKELKKIRLESGDQTGRLSVKRGRR